ncbi:hypothetical protein [Methylobacterium sp.]|uniref:hypothetical protein n=1 Tax=Methylobacterium sp. TaxID=409 RepID=UPI003B00CB04
MRSAFLPPTETPNKSLDVKKALLSFDKVLIPDPADRELIPPQSLMMAMGLPPFMGFNMGPVRPLGKILDYDSEFDRLMLDIDVARRQGLIEVVSSYDLSTSSQGTIGSVLMGDYPLNPRFMFWAYRSVAREDDVLSAALRGDQVILSGSDDAILALVQEQAAADGSINDDPALPGLSSPLGREHLRLAFTSIARARVASVMKSIGYCASKDLVPLFTNHAYAEVASSFASRAQGVLDSVVDVDPYWTRRTQALNCAYAEYIDDDVLDSMTIDQVLKLRTVAWGEHAEARDALLSSISELAKEEADDFSKIVTEKITEFRKKAGDLTNQRASLSFKINCELFKGGGSVATSLMAGSGLKGMLSQAQTGIGAATVLLAGCLWGAGKLQDHKAAVDELRRAETEFKDHVCFGVHNFYRRVSASVGSPNVS